MNTVKIFQNGRSQAVRLPKEYRFKDDEVYINKVDDIIMLFPKTDKWSALIASLDKFTDDFMSEREQPDLQSRDNMA